MQYLQSSACDVTGQCMQYMPYRQALSLWYMHASACVCTSACDITGQSCSYCMGSKVSSLSRIYLYSTYFGNIVVPWRQSYWINSIGRCRHDDSSSAVDVVTSRAMEPRPDVLLSVRDHLVFFHVPAEENDVDLRVLHSPDQDRN
jgi:hypothetical protein